MNALGSNLEGIAYVASRMEWYCDLIPHMLEGNNAPSTNMDQDSIIDKLRAKALQLYRSILVYQMKSACSYYRNQTHNFMLQMWNSDDWSGALEAVKSAESDLLSDWHQFDKVRASKVQSSLLAVTNTSQNHLDDIRQTL